MVHQSSRFRFVRLRHHRVFKFCFNTQYVFNNYLLNPALSGIENYVDVKLGHRNQWTGLEGAPKTTYFTVNAPIGTGYSTGDATGMPPAGETNPMSRFYMQNYEAARPHHGIGLMLVHDIAGPVTQTNINATYAYHIGLAPKVNLAVGISGGLMYSSLNSSSLEFQDGFDPLTNANTYSRWNPDLGAGVWAYSSAWYIGASIQQALRQTVYFDANNTQNQTVPHYFITAGVKLPVSDDVSLLPSALLKVTSPAPVSIDVNAKLAFRDRFWVGGSYRRGDAFSALLGLNLSSFVNVCYSYDFTTSALNSVSRGTHEIVIGIMLNNQYRVLSSQRVF